MASDIFTPTPALGYYERSEQQREVDEQLMETGRRRLWMLTAPRRRKFGGPVHRARFEELASILGIVEHDDQGRLVRANPWNLAARD